MNHIFKAYRVFTLFIQVIMSSHACLGAPQTAPRTTIYRHPRNSSHAANCLIFRRLSLAHCHLATIKQHRHVSLRADNSRFGKVEDFASEEEVLEDDEEGELDIDDFDNIKITLDGDKKDEYVFALLAAAPPVQSIHPTHNTQGNHMG